jgi:hypothetical protein
LSSPPTIGNLAIRRLSAATQEARLAAVDVISVRSW